jgi:hypothetical protein
MDSRLQGHVTFHGEPMPETSLRITVSYLDQTSRFNAASDKDGNYQTPPLPDGDAHIFITADNYLVKNFTTTIAPMESQRYDIELGGNSKVVGRILNWDRDLNGTACALEGVRELSALNDESTGFDFRDWIQGSSQIDPRDGSYYIDELTPGEYTILILGVDPRSRNTLRPIRGQKHIRLAEDQELEVNFQMR